MWREWHDNEHRIFGIHEIVGGKCSCGRVDCSAIGKHPRISRWQCIPHWSDEQLDNFEAAHHFATGYGVLVDGLLVVDVDARNGGVESYSKLIDAIPAVVSAGMIVNTGSGGGSQHLFFKIPRDNTSYRQHLHQYQGIDFKSSGFVVGAGSLHESGSKYDCVLGSVMDIDDAPSELLDMLIVRDTHRAEIDGNDVDVTNADLVAMLSAVDPDCDHEQWIRIGMALHHATEGSGFELWDDWSSRGSKYPNSTELSTRWHSFGKCTTPVTLGTLAHYANWSPPVVFEHTMQIDPDTTVKDHAAAQDLLRPPGLVGDVAQWINSQCMYPRENLAVAAALMSVSNAGGMRYYDAEWGVRANLFAFGVAGSGSGKNAILDCIKQLACTAGTSGALCGGIKSEQEIYRNLLANQSANYTIDEFGEVLSKIRNGKAHFLEGIVGTLMSAYSASGSTLLITGDLKRDVIKELTNELAGIQKRLSENETKNINAAEQRIEAIEQTLATIDTGLADPFLSVFGLSTPDRFHDLMDFNTANNGFMGRALIFDEHDDNPKMRAVTKTPPPSLEHIYHPMGYAGGNSNRVERVGQLIPIPSTPSALLALNDSRDEFWSMAEQQKESEGLVAIPRRAVELVAKVSLTLAMGEGTRTLDHVAWAHALVMHDTTRKLHIVNSNNTDDAGSALMSRLYSLLNDDGITIGQLRNQSRRKWSDKQDVDKAMELLIKCNKASVTTEQRGRNKSVKIYRSIDA